ncbi:questin oxidase family protein [Streptomyces sp. M19]
MEPARLPERTVSEKDWERLIGARTDFAGYCEFFDRQEKELGLDGLIRRYAPVLLPGWVGAFTHATIHLGWALDADNRWMIIEGLAYVAFAYVSCHPERAVPQPEARPGGNTGDEHHGDERAVDSLLRIADVWERDREALGQWTEDLIADPTPEAAEGIHPNSPDFSTASPESSKKDTR